MKPRFVFSLFASVLLLGGLQQQASATTYSWINAKITTWSDTTAWSGGVAPVSDLNNEFRFAISSNTTATNNLGANFQLNRLVATNTSSSNKSLLVDGNSLNFVKNSSDALPTLAISNTAVSGPLTIKNAFTVTDALTVTNSGSKSSTLEGAITNTGGMTFNGTGAGTINLGGGVTSGAGGITVNGSYTVNMTGNNTYTGLTDVQSGTLTLNRSGGTIANASAVRVSGGTLNVAQSDTVGAVTLSSGTISGAGTLTGASYSLTNTGAVNAVLGGSGVALTKSGAGTVTVSSANTYTGATTVSEGTLNLAAANAISSSSNVVLSGGGLESAFSQSLGTLNLTASSTLDLSTAGTFVFADSSSLAGAWSGILSIVGTFTDGLSVRFGSNSDGLTTGQLGQITINGLGADIDLNGYLVVAAIPEPSTYAMLAGVLALGMGVWRRTRCRSV
jgi:autotransporter-associated beta strand protein